MHAMLMELGLACCLIDRPRHTSWVAQSHGSRGNIVCHHASCANYCVFAYHDVG